MIVLSIILAVILTDYLVYMGIEHGIPDMVSDTYYQGAGKWFSSVMCITGMGMLPCILDTGKGVQCLAFLGCVGLILVGLIPMYRHCGKCHRMHKAGATVSALGCIGWSLTACPMVTAFIAVLFAAYLLHAYTYDSIEKVYEKYVGSNYIPHPWYWAEVTAFVDVFITYWVVE